MPTCPTQTSKTFYAARSNTATLWGSTRVVSQGHRGLWGATGAKRGARVDVQKVSRPTRPFTMNASIEPPRTNDAAETRSRRSRKPPILPIPIDERIYFVGFPSSSISSLVSPSTAPRKHTAARLSLASLHRCPPGRQRPQSCLPPCPLQPPYSSPSSRSFCRRRRRHGSATARQPRTALLTLIRSGYR